MTAYIRIKEAVEGDIDIPTVERHALFVDEADGRLSKKNSDGDVEKYAGIGDLSASDIAIEKIGTPAFNNVQDSLNLFLSAGMASGGLITDAGSSTVNVAAGAGFIRDDDDDTAPLLSFEWAASLGISIPANSIRYIGVEYNGGSPVVAVHTADDWNYDDEFPLGVVVRENGITFIFNRSWKTTDALGNIIERFDGENYMVRDSRVGGLILSGTGTRNVAVTAGQILSRMDEYPTTALDTSAAGSFETYYRDGAGSWTHASGATQWNNSQYDNGTGTLAALTTDFYTSRWFYKGLDDALIMVFGQAQYSTVGGLLEADVPPTPPKRIAEGALLVGRLIIKQGGTSPTKTESAFRSIFQAAIVSDHGELSGLGDDDHTQYHNDARADTWLAGHTFTSAAQNITSSGPLTLAHGLSSIPKFWDCHLVNVTAELNYTAGQIATIAFNTQGNNQGVNIRPDATNLNIRFGSATGVFSVVNQTTGAVSTITNANWQIVFKARNV